MPAPDRPNLVEENRVTGEITNLLQAWTDGTPAALDALVPAVQGELRHLAEAHLRRERRNHTLQPTALVNEAYLRLLKQRRVHWRNRKQFFAIASRIMRRLLVDHARKRLAAKRGGTEAIFVPWNDSQATHGRSPANVIALHDALATLSKLDERQAKIVELSCFGGLSMAEVAEVLGISKTTVKREFRVAKLWLFREMSGGAER